MTHAEQLAAFVVRASYGRLSEKAVHQLKIRVLDALGCAIGALGADLIQTIRTQVEDFGGGRGKTPPTSQDDYRPIGNGSRVELRASWQCPPQHPGTPGFRPSGLTPSSWRVACRPTKDLELLLGPRFPVANSTEVLH